MLLPIIGGGRGRYRKAGGTGAPVITGTMEVGSLISLTPGTWDMATPVVFSLYVNGDAAPILSKVDEATIEAFPVPNGAFFAKVREHALVGGAYQDSAVLWYRPENYASNFLSLEIGRSPYTLSGSDFTGTIGDLGPLGNDVTVVGAPGYEASGFNSREWIVFGGTPDRATRASTNNGMGATLTAATYIASVEITNFTNGLVVHAHGSGNNGFTSRSTVLRGTLGAVSLDLLYPVSQPFVAAFTWDGATIRAYRNGVLIGSTPSAGVGAADASGFFWASNTGAASHGQFKSAGFWGYNQMLTDAEVAQHAAYCRFQGMIA